MKKIKIFKPVGLGVYIAFIMSSLIILVAILYATCNLLYIRNMTKSYETNIYQLRYSISKILSQSLKIDSERKDYTSTKKIIEQLKKEDLLAYSYVQNNKTKKVIIGQDTVPLYHELMKTKEHNEVQMKHHDIGDYTVYFGIQTGINLKYKFSEILKTMTNILFVLVLLSIIVSIYVANILIKPLKNLSDAAKNISDGNFNINVDTSQFTEINDLIFSYNQMGFQLSELYSSLELKVQERTIALESANRKLQETQAMMVHSEKMRSLGELVAGIAHEINNPVNFIHGNIMILQNYVDDLMRLINMYEENNLNFPDDVKEKIEDLKKEIDLDFLKTDVNDLIKSCKEGTDRTKNIILDLKNFSRMEEMVLTQFDIPKEIDTTLNILNNKIKNRITVVKNYAENLPKIEAYGGQLNQVFMNILDNAQDAMGETGTLTINVYQVDRNVVIEFIDTGAGIPKENLNKVFDPFFTTKPVGKGTGLGMSISYRVINDHNGKIEIDSNIGKGTKFTITIPINHEKHQELLSDEEIIEDIRKENGVNNG